MTRPKFSEHDRDAIESVAHFCGTDQSRRMLAAVWIGDGWAIGTDAYRVDAREVDTDWSGPVDPVTFEPVRFDRDFDARWMALRTLVELSYLRQAVAHFDNPVRLRWESGRTLKAVRLDEDEHFHLLGVVRRSSL